MQICARVYRPFRSLVFHEILFSSNFIFNLQLDNVLEVLLVVGLKILLTKLVDKYHRKINWKKLGWLLNKWLIYLACWALERKKKKKTSYINFKIFDLETRSYSSYQWVAMISVLYNFRPESDRSPSGQFFSWARFPANLTLAILRWN